MGWWVVAGAIGVLLRYQLVWPITELNYTFLLHTHSHVVLLGWTFNALYLAVVNTFVESGKSVAYRRVWIGLQLAVLGMLTFFPMQGYAAGSIAFSTLHVFISYYLAWRVWQDVRWDRRLSTRLLRWGLLFLVASTLGPYALGVLKARDLQESIWYNLAIYFYLHFLYNGWFVFGCLALLFRWTEQRGLALTQPTERRLVAVLVGSCIGTTALSALWTNPPLLVWLLSGLSAFVQAGVGAWLIRWLLAHRRQVSEPLDSNAYRLFRLALFSFCLKLSLQLLSALPWAAAWTFQQRHLVIAYLHLVFIGFVTFFLLAWALQRKTLRWSTGAFGATILFFTLTEGGLVIESVLQKGGSYLPYFGEIMLLLSVGLWAGVVLLWLKQVNGRFVQADKADGTSIKAHV
ncbi:hypothetical protein GCM10027577_50860 [Spirosoma fluminis]